MSHGTELPGRWVNSIPGFGIEPGISGALRIIEMDPRADVTVVF